MRPRYQEVSTEVANMLEKAQSLLTKAEKLDMVEHDGKKVPAFAADGKGSKDEKKKADKCPSCGGKLDKAGGCMMKGSCEGVQKADKCPSCGGKLDKAGDCMMKDSCVQKYGTMKKGEHHKLQTFDTRPGGVQFMSESGGQTFNAQYQTNQSLLDSDDVANKGATSMSVNLEALRAKMNTHENPVEGHLTEG